MGGGKLTLIVLGGLAALAVVVFIGSAIVAGILDAEGVLDSSEEQGRKESGGARGSKDGERSSSRSRRPLLRVTRVIDGDTVDTDKQGRVRLIGVNTPEEGRCNDSAATSFTRQRLEGHTVGYELGAERKDRYGRTLAYLYPVKNMHNLDLVRGGHGKVLIIPPNDKYERRFDAAQGQARRADVGVWGVCERRIRRARVLRRRARVRRARERTRRLRERRSRPSPTPSPPSGGGGGGRDNFNIPGIPGD